MKCVSSIKHHLLVHHGIIHVTCDLIRGSIEIQILLFRKMLGKKGCVFDF